MSHNDDWDDDSTAQIGPPISIPVEYVWAHIESGGKNDGKATIVAVDRGDNEANSQNTLDGHVHGLLTVRDGRFRFETQTVAENGSADDPAVMGEQTVRVVMTPNPKFRAHNPSGLSIQDDIQDFVETMQHYIQQDSKKAQESASALNVFFGDQKDGPEGGLTSLDLIRENGAARRWLFTALNKKYPTARDPFEAFRSDVEVLRMNNPIHIALQAMDEKRAAEAPLIAVEKSGLATTTKRVRTESFTDPAVLPEVYAELPREIKKELAWSTRISHGGSGLLHNAAKSYAAPSNGLRGM